MAYFSVLFHKPFNVLSQFVRPINTSRPTLDDFIPVKDIYPVGRLDADSEGLMLLTNNGSLQHRLTDPRFRHPRTYWVQVEGEPTSTALTALERGLVVQGYRTLPAKAHQIVEPVLSPRVPPVRFRKSIPTAWIEITLTEGRNRQVRHMTAAVGFPTLRLIRCAIGHLRIEGLGAGDWRELKADELQILNEIEQSSSNRKGRPNHSGRPSLLNR